MPLQDRQRAAAQDMVGDVPALSSVAALDPTADPGSPPQLSGRRSSSTHGRFGINLPAIEEVLRRYNLDPADEVAQLLVARQPVTDRNGAPVLDDKGEPVTEPVLRGPDRAKLAVELLQYTRPKLKAIEHTHTPPELTDEQIAKRLESLLTPGRRPGAN